MKKDLDIELFLLCYNEEKMIPHTLNYYTRFCRSITIFDNDSTDNSLELIRSLNENINIKRFDSDGEYREDLLMQTKNNCWKGSSADYVIVCDMDEFLYDESLLEKLAYAKEKGIAIPMVSGYNMMSTKFPDNYDQQITDQIKFGYKDRMFDKNIIFDPKQVKDINFGPGCHYCKPSFYKETIRDELVELKLLHYKYLDKSYIYKKHRDNARRMSAINKEMKWGKEYLKGDDFVDKKYKQTYYLIKVIK